MNGNRVRILSIGLFLSLLLWGVWTLLYYIGIPAHTSVLAPNAQGLAAELCAPTAFVCRGVYVLFPFIINTLTRVPFLVWYAAICAVLYGLWIVWGFIRKMQWRCAITMSPWKILLLFVFFMWMIFTCLSFTQSTNLPLRTIIEPRHEVYQGAGAEALETLQANYVNLKERGCLKRIGLFAGVAEASTLKTHCIQMSFFTRVLPPLVVVLIFLFELLILGRLILRSIFRIRPDSLLMESLLSAGIGAGGWIVLIWFAAVFSIYTPLVGWGLVLFVPIVGFRHAQYWLEKFIFKNWKVDQKWYSVQVLLFWLLLSYLALNFVNVVRPFPIGWDDLGSYVNRPRLLVSYGSYIFSMAAFQWEYLTSLGFLLFGYDSFFGATSALMINWTEGVLAVLAVYMFVRVFLGEGRGLLAALLYYTLPLVGHFSFADMKIDNAVFTMGALATFSIFYAFLKNEDKSQKTILKWVALGGVFGAFAFSMKVTAVMVLMSLGAVLMGLALHWTAFPAGLLFVLGLYAYRNVFNMSRLLERLDYPPDIISTNVLAAIFVVSGAFVLAWSIRRAPGRLRLASLSVLVFVAAFVGTIFPWMEHNVIQHGGIIPQFALGSPNNFKPLLDPYGEQADLTPFSLPPELAIDRNHPTCKPTGAVEELGRYWGTRKGWEHYLTLPFRLVMNLDSVGYYVSTQPSLLLFPLLLLLPFFWKRSSSWIRWMWGGTVFLVIQWAFLANGVPWYGIGTFLGLVICLEVLVAKSPDLLSKILTTVLITLSVLVCLGNRFWQYDSQKNLFEYPIGKVTAEAIRERTIPHYDDITDIVVARHEAMPDRPLLYRVGTFLPYFVPKNLEIIGASDHQLDYFNCLYQDRDAAKMTQRLKGLGFNSIVFDTNTATIEKNSQGSLHAKVQAFVDYLNNPESGVQIVINDPKAGITFLLIP
ncbi:MAG: hypothetical protein QF442_02375 [Candidatus Peribacteraceae bacterium]|nr:hypothetical protein [Candidatus Peribacteraceae bacterium]